MNYSTVVVRSFAFPILQALQIVLLRYVDRLTLSCCHCSWLLIYVPWECHQGNQTTNICSHPLLEQGSFITAVQSSDIFPRLFYVTWIGSESSARSGSKIRVVLVLTIREFRVMITNIAKFSRFTKLEFHRKILFIWTCLFAGVCLFHYADIDAFMGTRWRIASTSFRCTVNELV